MPATVMQPAGGRNIVQFLHMSPSFGIFWYLAFSLETLDIELILVTVQGYDALKLTKCQSSQSGWTAMIDYVLSA